MKNKKPGQVAAKWDPTRTSPIVRGWNAEMKRRVAAFVKELREVIAKNNDYGLGGMKTNAQQYAYLTSADKLVTFRKWVDDRLRYHMLDMMDGPTKLTQAGQWWANKYLQSAYKKGMVRAGQEMKARGFKEYQRVGYGQPMFTEEQWVSGAILAPTHADRVALIYSRTFESMKGITEQMAKRMSDTLADGMVAGDDPYAVAKTMADETGMALTRARMISRTETIRAHHVGSVNTYREAGLEGVEVQAELATVAGGTGDYEALHVCKVCQALEKQTKENPMTLDQVEGLIPVHPNCMVSGKTPILTSKGWVPIADIKLNDEVVTHKGWQERVTALHRSVADKPHVVTLYFSKGRKISMTFNHPVLFRGRWIEAKDVSAGDKLMFFDKFLREEEVIHVRHYTDKRNSVRLYNLTVARDESYIAKGLVVHNCRCVAIPRVMNEDELLTEEDV